MYKILLLCISKKYTIIYKSKYCLDWAKSNLFSFRLNPSAANGWVGLETQIKIRSLIPLSTSIFYFEPQNKRISVSIGARELFLQEAWELRCGQSLKNYLKSGINTKKLIKLNDKTTHKIRNRQEAKEKPHKKSKKVWL